MPEDQTPLRVVVVRRPIHDSLVWILRGIAFAVGIVVVFKLIHCLGI